MFGKTTAELLTQLENQKITHISFHYHTEKILKLLDSLFTKILAKEDKIFLLDSIITILRELISNAVKANAKRYFFKKINIDINDKDKYEEGIKSFKANIIGSDDIENELKETDYMATLSISLKEEDIVITVSNNVGLHPEEVKRINLRVARAKEYKDFSEAYDEIYDDTEGAGLGIVLTMLLLKNSGLGENSFKISSGGEVTKSTFLIPRYLKPVEITTKIKKEIVNEVKVLPSFSEHILELQGLCKDPNASIGLIVEKIKIDPSLTADILKLSNSAGFISGKRVEQINEAIMIIGLSNLYDLLIVTGTRRIMEKRYPKFQEIWNHCNKTAMYSRLLSYKFGNGKKAEFAYLGGLLHDLGKLVLLATDTMLTSRISDITRNRKIRTSTVLEEVSLGISHSSIGELIAHHWRFPEYLVETIKYHHAPLGSLKKYHDIVFPVYLANMFCGLETGKYHLFYFDDEVLNKYNLSSESDIEGLHSELKNFHG